MGEIGAIMARLEEEGIDLEQLIDRELQEAGFLSVATRSTESLSDRIDAVSGNQSELKSLLKSIEDQLLMIQEADIIPESFFDDKELTDNGNQVKNIIVIDDDEGVPKSDFGCQAEIGPKPTAKKTSVQPSKLTEKHTCNLSQPPKSTTVSTSNHASTMASSTKIVPSKTISKTPNQTVPILPKVSKSPLNTPKNVLQTTPLNMPLTQPVASPEGVIAYRTLKSPCKDGPAKSVVSMVTVKSSQPITPPEYVRGAKAPTTPSVSTLDATPVTQTRPTSTTKVQSSVATVTTATATVSVSNPRPIECAPPVFNEETRVIGKRSDDLWYPGEIVKVIIDRNNQTKFRVKFDQGNRGLLRSNHIALETSAPKGVLDVGSRVVGPYGKLDVLYAGIVTEKSCAETKNRFLIFFDDGFAQYLPVSKLHHVYNTGDKVWTEVAEHSQEFIQEYLEEFPNRPMVVLKANQWVKTEWRGKWLKAKVVMVDCSLVKMLFQVDNRTEWIYRGSTRLEPLFKALIDGKISKKKTNKKRKQSQAPDEPYVDFSVTKPQFGLSIYSKTDPKGLQQQKSMKDDTTSKQTSQTDQTSSETGPSSSKSSSTQGTSASTSNTPSTAKTLSNTTAAVTTNSQPPLASSSNKTTTQSNQHSLQNTASLTTQTPNSMNSSSKTASLTMQTPNSIHPSSKTASLTTKTQNSVNASPNTASLTTQTQTSMHALPNTASLSTQTPNFMHSAPKTASLTTQTQNPSAPKTASLTMQTQNPMHPSPNTSSLTKQTQNTMALRTLKRIAHKVNDDKESPPKMTSMGTNTMLDVRGSQSYTTQSVNTNNYSIPDSTINTSWMTNNHDRDFTTNHFSAVNHFDDSTASIIHASTMRKRTSAGLHVGHKSHVMDVGPGMVLPGVPNGIIIPKIGLSPKKMWEAPWKRNSHADTLLHKEPIKIKTKLKNSKHDAAALIEERLQAQKKLERSLKTMPEIQSLVTKPPVLGPHKCGKHCGQMKRIDKEEKSKHNVLALPLLLYWKREITKRYPKSKREIYYRAPCNKRLRSIEDVAKYLLLTGTYNVSIDQFCFDPEISCSDVAINLRNILFPDISQGLESVCISVMNEHDDSVPPDVDYVNERILSEGVRINIDPGFLACCDCTDNCQDKTKCSCAQLTISASAAVDGKVDNTVGYEYRRLVDTVPTGIYECNQNCACSNQCFNRVVQNGIQLRLQVFKTENRGWGLRTLDDISHGTFICTYSGQIMNEDMANKEGRDFGDEYLAELDHIEVVEKIKEGYESSVSDLEDDSVILKTLETGNSTSGQSDIGSDGGASFMSDTDSDDSDSSHSSYSPRAKRHTPTKRKSTDFVKITEADGTSFSVTMADEKCVMAISSGESIVLKRIGGSGDVKQENKPFTVKQEDQTKDPNLQKDPPPMPTATVIDLTSDDEDNHLINYSTNETPSDQTFELFENNENDIKNAKNDEEKDSAKTRVKAFTDFKIFDLSDENMETSDVTDSCHDKSDVTDDVKTDTKDKNDKETEDLSSFNGNGEENSQVAKTDIIPVDRKGLESIVDESQSSLTTSDDAISSPCKVTRSVTEVTKQENMESDPCLREQQQQLPKDDNKTSSSLNSDKTNPPNSFLDNGRHGNDKDSKQDKHQNDNCGLQGNSCPGNKDSFQGNECPDNSLQGNSCPGTSHSLQDKSSIHGNDESGNNSKGNDGKHSHGDKNSFHGDVSKKQDKVNECNSNNIENNGIPTEDNVTKDCNLDNCSQGNVNDAIHVHKDTDKSDIDVKDGNDSNKDKQCVDNDDDGDNDGDGDDGNYIDNGGDNNGDDDNGDDGDDNNHEGDDNDDGDGDDNGGGVDFELRMDVDESMESLEDSASEPRSNDSSKLPNTTKNTTSDDDSVPSLMSADDLSKLAAGIHQPDEEPPTLTKMQPGSKLTVDLHDTIAKLQSRGVALDNPVPETPEEDSTQSFDDLPLFPSASSGDSFPPSPTSSHSGSWVSDSVEISSEASIETNTRRDRMKNDGRRARRFIVTLQKSGNKRHASPDGIERCPYKRPTTRSLFNGEEHCYVIDAKAYGNCGRYLNHSCSPNLFVQNVFIDTHDLRFPHVAFFAQHNIRAGSELTWDYMYEVGSVQDKVLRCYCGSSQCRGRLL